MNMRRAAAAALIALLLGVGLPAMPVQAHANLINASPSAGQALERFPTSARLEFSESVNPANARVQLINAAGEIVADGTVSVDASAPAALRVALPSRPNGVYSLSWRVQSAVDGHFTEGTLAFSVGLNGPKASLLPPPGTPDPSRQLPAGIEVLLRWVGYLSLSLVMGSALFGVWVWRPAFRAAPDAPAEWDQRLTRLLAWLIRLGAAGVALSLLGLLIWAVIESGQGGTGTPEPFLVRLDHQLGHGSELLWFRMGGFPLFLLLLASTLTPAGGGAADGTSARPWWEVAGVGLALLGTYSLSSHSAAFASPLPMLVDWLHLTSMTIWIGGLLPLTAVLLASRGVDHPAAPGLINRVSHRFSRMALTCVILLGLSGLYAAYVQVGTLAALIGTRYGQTILIKTALFAALIGLGALNQLGILPRMARAGVGAARALSRSVRIEVVLGLLTLAAVGALVSLPPGLEALKATYRQGYHETYQTQGARIDFRAAPAAVGDNEFGVSVVDPRPGAEQVKPTVLLRISKAGAANVQQTQVEAELESPESTRYVARGSYFASMGVWNVLVIWRKPGFDDITHTFSIDLAQIAAQRGEEINPVPADAASVADGRALYAQNCAPCHGADGKGDGPAGRALNPPPSDLTQHAVPGIHTDGQLFDWISEGFTGSAMPAFKDTLSAKQRWDLVNFMRTLAPQSAPPAP